MTSHEIKIISDQPHIKKRVIKLKTIKYVSLINLGIDWIDIICMSAEFGWNYSILC